MEFMNTPRGNLISRQRPITSTVWWISAFCVLPTSVAGGALPQLEVRKTDPQEQSQADLETIWRDHNIPGMSAAGRCDGALIWSAGVGLSAPGDSATAQTRYRIASVSKVLTAGVAASLVSQGRLVLDAPVGHYLPELPSDWGAPTSRQLLAHLGGVAHYRLWELENKPHFDSAVSATSVFVGRRIRPPGQRRYSSYGFVLASAAMESAGGDTFVALLASEVLEPLGMHRTGPDAAECSGCAVSWRRWPLTRPRPAAFADLSYKWAAGGLSSTVLDLTAYGAAWLAPGFVDAQTLEEALTPVRDGADRPVTNGLGWRLYPDPMTGKPWAFGHGGSVLGGGAALWVDTRTGVSVAMLSNVRRHNHFTLKDAQRIGDRFAGCRQW